MRCDLRQATYTDVSLSPSSINNLVPAKGLISVAGKVTAGLVESKCMQPTTGFMTNVTCGLTERNRNQLRAQRS